MPLSQVLINGLITGALYSLFSVGYTLIYGMLRFPNFAYAEFAVLGAYLAILFCAIFGLNLPIAILIAAPLTGLIGIISDRVIFRRIRTASLVSSIIATFGLGIVIRSSIRAIWGSTPKGYPIGLQKPVAFLSSWIKITFIQLLIISTVAAFMILIYVLLYKTKLGKSMRAVQNNLPLTEACAINSENVIAWVWFISASIAAVAGFLIGLETQVHPYMGLGITINIFAATLLGGLGNPIGAVVGSLVLGFAKNILVWFDWGLIVNLGGVFDFVKGFHIPTGYKDSVAFFTLIIVFVYRPSGILGRR